MKVVYGNLLDMADEGQFDIIMHGCNCHGIMGAGIAKQIKDRYPLVYENDLKSCNSGWEPETKLGKFTWGYPGEKDYRFRVLNLYTQLDLGADFRPEALDSALSLAVEVFGDRDRPVRWGFPQIGCGIGGGDWNEVKAIFEKHLDNEDATLVMFVNKRSILR